MTLFLICLSVTLFFTTYWLFAIKEEYKLYNGGYCRKCGSKLYSFDMASDGSVGYTCPKCHYTIWLSWINPKH